MSGSPGDLPPYVNHLPAVLRDGTELTRILFVRHGQQVPAPAGTLPQVWMDSPLTELGVAQARAVGDHLAGERLAAVASSDLQRARQTAEAIAARRALEVQEFSGLSEIGCYSGVPADVWPADHVGSEAWAAAHATFAHDARWEVFGCGETGAQLRERAVAVVDALVEKHRGESVAVVCHGGTINAYLSHWLGIAADMFFLPAHASVSVVLASADGRRAIESLNDRHHLSAAGLLTF